MADPIPPARVRTVAPPLLLAVAAGFGVAAAGPWRPGLLVAAVTLVLAGVLRIVLPPVRLGSLVVRSRVVDAAVLLGAGGGLIGLALTFPAA